MNFEKIYKTLLEIVGEQNGVEIEVNLKTKEGVKSYEKNQLV